MLIGVDLDNTIVCYDELLRAVALEQELIPDSVPASKQQVRDWLRAAGQEDRWTELQGCVYGPRMHEAPPFTGVLEFFARCRAEGVRACIISHRSRFPYLGAKHDLHQAAWEWLAAHGLCESMQRGLCDSVRNALGDSVPNGPDDLLQNGRGDSVQNDVGDSVQNDVGGVRVYLELTKEEKLARIAQAGCSHFIDDLPEFLVDPAFPPGVVKILFDPAGMHPDSGGMHRDSEGVIRAGSWAAIERLIFPAKA